MERVSEALVAMLAAFPLPVVMVLHANHGNEVDAEVEAVCARLRSAGVTLLNQSVLLRGINDSARALATLSGRLFDAGVLPYYLHQLDPVAGAAHFAVSDEQALDLQRQLQASLPGYLVPRLVRETPHGDSKTLVFAPKPVNSAV